MAMSTTFGAVVDAAQRKSTCLLACGQRVLPLSVRDQQRRTADIQSMIDLGCLVAIVERRRDKSGLEAGQIMDKKRSAVRQQRGHAVAMSKAQPQIVPGQPSRSL